MCYPLATICFQIGEPATSHPHAADKTNINLKQYPIKAQGPLHLFCILLATKAPLVSPFPPLFLILLTSRSPSTPCCPLSWYKSPTKRVSSFIIIGSQAPIPKLSVQQHLGLEDRSKQSKISSRYYSCCTNKINDMCRPVCKY